MPPPLLKLYTGRIKISCFSPFTVGVVGQFQKRIICSALHWWDPTGRIGQIATVCSYFIFDAHSYTGVRHFLEWTTDDLISQKMATTSDLAILRGRSTYIYGICINCLIRPRLFPDCPRITSRSEAAAIFYKIIYGPWASWQKLEEVVFFFFAKHHWYFSPAELHPMHIRKGQFQDFVTFCFCFYNWSQTYFMHTPSCKQLFHCSALDARWVKAGHASLH